MSRIHFESVNPVSPDDDPSDRARRSRVPVGKAIVLAAFISAGALALGWLQRQVEEPAATLTWSELTREARRSQRNIAVLFTRPGCVPCVRMKSESLADAGVARLITRGWILHEVDLGTAGAAALATQYGVSEPPTLVLAAAGGVVLRDVDGQPMTATGYLDAGALRALLTRDRQGGDAENREDGQSIVPVRARASAN